MNDTVSDKDVGEDNLGVVDVDIAALKIDSEVLATKSWDTGVVHEISAIKD